MESNRGSKNKKTGKKGKKSKNDKKKPKERSVDSGGRCPRRNTANVDSLAKICRLLNEYTLEEVQMLCARFKASSYYKTHIEPKNEEYYKHNPPKRKKKVK